MKTMAPSLAPMLRSDTQGRLLARILVDPAQEHSVSDLARWTNASMPTVLREVGRAERAGIVATRKVGPARVVRANPDHPLHGPVRRLILATFGPPAVVAREFASLDLAGAVVLFGSWAAGYLGEPPPLGEQRRAPNDVDLLVIGSPLLDDVDDAAERAEREIGLPVQATVCPRFEWLAGDDAFLRQVRAHPLVVVLADEHDHELHDELGALQHRWTR